MGSNRAIDEAMLKSGVTPIELLVANLASGALTSVVRGTDRATLDVNDVTGLLTAMFEVGLSFGVNHTRDAIPILEYMDRDVRDRMEEAMRDFRANLRFAISETERLAAIRVSRSETPSGEGGETNADPKVQAQ